MPSSQNYFESKNIIFVEKYEFKDGVKHPIGKIIIFLYCDDNSTLVIQSQTTSQDKKINLGNFNHGCNNKSIPNFYFFDKNIPVGEDKKGNEFKFDLDTYLIFRNSVSIEDSITYLLKYKDNISYLGKLSDVEHISLLKCLIESKFVAINIQKILKDVFNI